MPINRTPRFAVKCSNWLRENFFPNNCLTSRVKANQVKDRLTEIDAECVNLHGPPPLYAPYIPKDEGGGPSH